MTPRTGLTPLLGRLALDPPNLLQPRVQPARPDNGQSATGAETLCAGAAYYAAQVASLVLQQRYIRIGDSCGLEMLLAKGASGARERYKEFGALSAVVVLAEGRLNPEPTNANTLLFGMSRNCNRQIATGSLTIGINSGPACGSAGMKQSPDNCDGHAIGALGLPYSQIIGAACTGTECCYPVQAERQKTEVRIYAASEQAEGARPARILPIIALRCKNCSGRYTAG